MRADIESNASEPEAGVATPLRYVLAAAWVLLPAVQYVGTYQRTSLQIEGTALLPALADLDLTTSYLALLSVTILYVVVQWMSARRPAPPVPKA